MIAIPMRPDGHFEDELRRMAADILKMPPQRLDPDANLGNFGFDSLSLKVFADRLGARLGTPLSPVIFYAHSTIRSLAAHLRSSAPAERIAPAEHPEPAITPPPAALTAPAAPAAHGARPALVPWSNQGFRGVPARAHRAGKAEAGEAAADIAIIGMAGIFPGSPDLAAFWEHLCAMRDLISEAPPERWDWRSFGGSAGEAPPRWAGFIADADRFDADFFRLSRLEAELMDPQQRLFLQTCWHAVEDAGQDPQSLTGKRVGVFAGVQFNDYQLLLGKDWGRAQAATGNAHAMIPNRVSFLLDLRGPSEAFDTACSGSLVAVHRAVRALAAGECETAIAGGVSLILSPDNILCAGRLGILSPAGRCRTFDAEADGYVKGEGVGAIYLKPLARALADRDPVYAVIRGAAVNHGGRAASLTAPNPEAQAEVIARAHGEAGFAAGTVSYLETHGTATRLGDPVEIEGIKSAFARMGVPAGAGATECWLGAVKANIGHLEPAAGIAGVIKTALAIRNRRIPGTPNFRALNPLIALDRTPFRVAERTLAWDPRDARGESMPLRAGVSSFGFGGANAHIALEEAPRVSGDAPADAAPRLFVLSARTPESLAQYARDVGAFLARRDPDIGDTARFLADLCHTYQCGRAALAARFAAVVADVPSLRASLEAFAAGREGAYHQGHTGTAKPFADLLAEGPAGAGFVRALAVGGDLDRLARCWTAGLDLDWSLLHTRGAARISAPGYPFAKDRYWIPGPVVAAPQGNSEITVRSVPAGKPPAGAGAAAAGDLAAFLAIRIGKHLKSERVPGGDEGFADLGVDSVLAVELIQILNRELDLALEPTALYNYPDIRSLAGHIGGQFGSVPAVAALLAGSPASAASAASATSATSTAPRSVPRSAVAIIGMAGRFPGAEDVDLFWENLREGRDTVTEVPPERWDFRPHFDPQPQKPNKTYSRWGGFLKDVDKFDPRFFGLMPLEARYMDPQQRMVLEEAWKACEDAGYSKAELAGTRCGVFLGIVHTDYADVVREADGNMNAFAMLGNHIAVAPARISYFLDLKGPAMALDTACSSSLVAVHQACRSILQGECDLALAGGVYAAFTPVAHILCSAGGMLSPRGKCRTFDDGADGLAIGEAVGMVMLKDLDAAMADGDRVLAVIRASGINQDGKTNGITAPNALSQADLELSVYAQAGIRADTLSYVEAHGTGTRLGDPVEIEGLAKAFRAHTDRKGFCALGSVKPNIGHTYQAAGIASLIKVVQSLRHRQIPPSLHVETENRHVRFADTPFFVNKELRAWEAPPGLPRRAAISSFGYSGTNAHLIVEEAPAQNVPDNPGGPQVVVLSARSAEGLRSMARNLIALLARAPGPDGPSALRDLAATSQLGRTAFAHRLALLAADRDQVRARLADWLEGHGDVPGVLTGIAEGPERPAAAAGPAALAAAWVAGATVDWRALHPQGYRKVTLPHHPFERVRCWPGPAPIGAAPGAVAPAEAAQVKVGLLKPLSRANASNAPLPAGGTPFSKILPALAAGIDSF